MLFQLTTMWDIDRNSRIDRVQRDFASSRYSNAGIRLAHIGNQKVACDLPIGSAERPALE
jgi:hypothetical protein